MYPQYPYPPPPPPPKRGLSTLTIVLIVLGCVLLIGFGSCMVVGGLVVLGAASAQKDALDAGAEPPASATTATTAEPGSTTEPPPTVLGGDGENDDDADDDDAKGNARTGATSPGAAAGTTTKWMCNATGWVRVCGFANVCNNMMMSGTGVGNDRQSAYNMAKLACEGMIRARGGSGVCTVACTPNAH